MAPLLAPLPPADLKVWLEKARANATPTGISITTAEAQQRTCSYGGHDDCMKNAVAARFPKANVLNWQVTLPTAPDKTTDKVNRDQPVDISFEYVR